MAVSLSEARVPTGLPSLGAMSWASHADHVAHFFDDESFPAGDIGRFLSEGAAAGGDELTRDGRRAYIYGDIVDVLSCRGEAAAAAALEQVWNELLEERPISLYCGYSTAAFTHAGGPAAFAGACVAHSVVKIGQDAGRRAADQQLVAEVLNEVLALERAALYEETERHRRTELAASRAKDEFIAMLGHELRNPIAAIHTAAEVLRVVDGDAQRRRWHEVLTRQIAHMTNILDDVLDVSRVTHGKIRLERRPLDLLAVMRDAVHDKREQIAAKGLTLRADFGDEDEILVHGNRSRLMQVLDNLLDNAIKFTHAPGEVAVTCLGEEGRAVLTISDTGAGIEPELLPHVFEPFTQGAQDSARSAGGLGLGLALVKQMVALHDGTLHAKSDGRGRGSKFTILIPRAEWQPPGDVPPPVEPPELPPDGPPELPPDSPPDVPEPPPEQPSPRPAEVPQRERRESTRGVRA